MAITAAEETLAVVHAWYGQRGDWRRVTELAGPEYIRHEPSATRVVTGEEIRDELNARGFVIQWEYEAFAEGDTAFVVWVAPGAPGGTLSGVQVYRVAGGRLVETWLSAIAPAVWPIRAAAGEGDPEANKELLRRWYAEMYGQRRFAELAPQLCGPVFIRHEATGTFELTAEEHGARLQRYYDSHPEGTSSWPYRAFASGDMVGVIVSGEGVPGSVQVWRVEDGRFVESWWAGVADVAW